MIEVDVQVKGLGGIANKIMANDDTKQKIVDRYAELVDPWVPYRTGEMSMDYTTTPDHIVYNMPYSGIRYYVPAREYTTIYHPLATYQWDKVAMQSGQREPFTNYARTALIRQLREFFK